MASARVTVLRASSATWPAILSKRENLSAKKDCISYNVAHSSVLHNAYKYVPFMGPMLPTCMCHTSASDIVADVHNVLWTTNTRWNHLPSLVCTKHASWHRPAKPRLSGTPTDPELRDTAIRREDEGPRRNLHLRSLQLRSRLNGDQPSRRASRRLPRRPQRRRRRRCRHRLRLRRCQTLALK